MRLQSARFHVQEECTKCHSQNLAQEPFVHDFKYALQGFPNFAIPAWRRPHLPQIRAKLTHFGFEYDKPGTMMYARLQPAASEPAVGFICLDSGALTSSEASAYTRQLLVPDDHSRHRLCRVQPVIPRSRAMRYGTPTAGRTDPRLNAAAKKFNDDKIHSLS